MIKMVITKKAMIEMVMIIEDMTLTDSISKDPWIQN